MVEVGLGAEQALSVPGSGRVVGAYGKAAYLKAPGGLVALTTPDAPPGPLHARTTADVGALRVGDPVVVTPTHLTAGPISVDLRTSRRWRGPLPSAVELAAATPLALRLLGEAPLSCVPGPHPVELVARGDLPKLTRRLGGLGPGLTPAGDDCLAGIFLVARIRWGEADLDRIAATVETNDIARAFLVWAARGQSIEPVHRFLIEPTSRALAALSRVGHSSGADLALGLQLGLQHLPAVPPGSRLAS